MTKRTTYFLVSCHLRHLESLAAKLSTQLSSRRLWLSPSQFSSRKGPNCYLRTGFCNGTMTHSTPPLQSRTSKAAKVSRRSAKLPICRILLQWDFFFFLRVKLELAHLPLSQDSFKTSLLGVVQTIAILFVKTIHVSGPLGNIYFTQSLYDGGGPVRGHPNHRQSQVH
jgi:hypothetical protein